jgi:hypothetical protein
MLPALKVMSTPLSAFQTITRGLRIFARKIQRLTNNGIGAALAGGALGGSFGAARAAEKKGGGCFCRPGNVTAEQTLLIDTLSSWTLTVLVYGEALDSRQVMD